MDDDDRGMRIVDRQMRKGQAEVTGEAPRETTNLDVADGEQQLEKRRLENTHGDWKQKPDVTLQELG